MKAWPRELVHDRGPEEFLDAAGEFLRADPARNTVMLTVTEDLRVKAAARRPSEGAVRLVAAARRSRTESESGRGRWPVHAHAGLSPSCSPG